MGEHRDLVWVWAWGGVLETFGHEEKPAWSVVGVQNTKHTRLRRGRKMYNHGVQKDSEYAGLWRA